MASVPHGSVASPRVVGRDPELGQLGYVLDQLQQGNGGVVVIGGEAGIGKTRLIDEAIDQVGDAIRVLRGDCLVLGATIPYLPFAQMLRELIHGLPQHELVKIIGPARSELARFMPELAIVAPAETSIRPNARMNGEIERLRLYEALLRVGERIVAGRPTLFVIEDIQWIDPASLELLAFLTHAMSRNEQASLVVSVRSEALADGASSVLTFLADLERSSAVERIELGSLDAEGTRHQVAAILGQQPASELAARIHALADGNPLFAEELLAATNGTEIGGDELPPKLRDLLAARLARLPDDALAVLRVAAAAGRTLDERLLADAAGLDDVQVESAVRAAVDEHILVRNPGAVRPSYRFRHEIMRALVASQLLPTEAARVHAAYAQALSREPAERQNESEIAFHWDGSGQADQALPARARAGKAAADAYAFEQAQEHYERVLALWTEVDDPSALVNRPRAWMAERAASAAGRAGDFDRAIELSRSVIDDGGDGDDIDPELFEQARSSLRWYLWDSGQHELGRDEAMAVVDDPEVLGRWRANALGHLGGLLLSEQRTAEAKGYASEALALARSVDAREEQILAEGVLGWCLVLEGDVEDGIAAMRKALEAARMVDDAAGEGRFPVGLSLAHAQLASALEMVGWLEQAHEVARDGIEVAAQQGVARTYGSTLRACAARTLYHLGHWEEAAAETEDALSHGALGAGRVALLTVRALLAVGRGDDATTKAALGEAESLIDSSTPVDVRRWMVAAVAEDELWQGQPMVALTRLAILEDEDTAPGVSASGRQPTLLDASVPRLLALAARAAADLALQERAAGIGTGLSDAAATQVQAALKRIGRRKALAEAWRSDIFTARAELARGDSDHTRTVRRWKAAADASKERPYVAAYATWRLAESQLARRDGKTTAAEVIEAGLGLADSLGAKPIADELRDLARRAGLATDRGADGTTVEHRGSGRPFGLTTREVEVLSLLADGMSNQEIADRLFISPKTASVHVSNIYGKLGVESRVAAATTAASLGLTGAPATEDATRT